MKISLCCDVRLCTVVALVLLCGAAAVSGCQDNYGLSMCVSFRIVDDNCTNTSPHDVSNLPPCRRVCHPEDCLLSDVFERELMSDQAGRLDVIKYRIKCIEKIAERSRREGCFDEAHFNNVTRTFLSEYVYRYNVLTPPPHLNPVFHVLSSGSAVLFPTLLHHKRFSLCVKFALSQELNSTSRSYTSLLSFTDNKMDLFRLSLGQEGKIYFQSVYKGAAVYRSPTPFTPGLVTSLCVSFRFTPRLQTTMWIRNEGELVTRLQPIIVRPFTSFYWNYDYLLGIVSVGESPKRPPGFPSFVGEVYSVRVLDRFLTTRKQVLPFIRCEDDVLADLKSLVSGALGMATWKNDSRVNGTVWSQETELVGDVTVRNGTSEDVTRFCGEECASLEPLKQCKHIHSKLPNVTLRSLITLPTITFTFPNIDGR